MLLLKVDHPATRVDELIAPSSLLPAPEPWAVSPELARGGRGKGLSVLYFFAAGRRASWRGSTKKLSETPSPDLGH